MEVSGGEDKVKFLKNKKIKFALILTSACLVLAIGYTFAYYNSTTSIANKMATKEVAVEIIEKFSQGSEFLPGEEVEKQVRFANVGESDALIRVRYNENWTDQAGNNVSGDVELVNKVWTNYWQSEWVDGNDGFYYYNKVLKPGTQTNIILDSLALLDEASNDRHAFDYSGLIYQITFELESCNANEKETQNNFSKSVTISGDNVTWSDYNGDENPDTEGN